jgi:hypothetical protein
MNGKITKVKGSLMVGREGPPSNIIKDLNKKRKCDRIFPGQKCLQKTLISPFSSGIAIVP